MFSFGPTFRAENSKSRLHLSEFYMIEAELAFATDVEEIAKEAEMMLKNVTKSLIDKGEADLRAIEAPQVNWLDKNFGMITYDEAVNVLNNHADRLTFPLKYGDGLSKEHELFLTEYNSGVPIFVVDFPIESKPFYMRESRRDRTKVRRRCNLVGATGFSPICYLILQAAAMDLLAPVVGELIGGSMREDNYDILESKLTKLTTNLDWYLELRKYGNVPSGGFGMGFERYLQSILGITNIKDTIPFPRWPHNCKL